MDPQVLSTQTSVVITFLASFLIWVMFGGLFILWVIDGKVKKEQVLHAIFAILIAWSASTLIKEMIPSTRPFVIKGYTPLTLTIPKDSAFPSNHAAVAFSMAVSIWLHRKKWGLLFLLGAILVAVGRVLANVHYFHDIAGGVVIGVLSAYAIERLHLYHLIK